MRTVVIPSGDKPSVVADAPEDYAKDTSPDKVGIFCSTVLSNCVLCPPPTTSFNIYNTVFSTFFTAPVAVAARYYKISVVHFDFNRDGGVSFA